VSLNLIFFIAEGVFILKGHCVFIKQKNPVKKIMIFVSRK
jgi:hypothetical protein